MKKINRIHIGGHKFYFEEDAASTIEQYLARIEELYKGNGEELKVSDVETRIADICLEKVGEDGIVPASLIEEAIKTIGINIEEKKESNQETNDEKTAATENESDTIWYKAMLKGSKLFRDTHGSYIAGVISGLSIHFGISAGPLRIITVLLFLLTPSPLDLFLLLAYFLLWAIVPKAVSIMDYTRMRRINLSVNDEATKAAWKKSYEQSLQELTNPEPAGCMRTTARAAFYLLIALIALPVTLCVIAAIVICVIFIAMGSAVLESLNLSVFTLLGIFITLAIPLFALTHYVLKRRKVCKPMKKHSKAILAVLWAVTLIVTLLGVNKFIDSHRGIPNVHKILHDYKNILCKYGDISITTGEYYNTYPVESDKEALLGRIWDATTCNIPFIIESINDNDGIYQIYFYTPGATKSESLAKIKNKDYVVSHRIETHYAVEIHGWQDFAWDSISNTLYIKSIEHIGTNSQTRRTGPVNVDLTADDDTKTDGMQTFGIYYYGLQERPLLLIKNNADDSNILQVNDISSFHRHQGNKNIRIRNIDIKADCTGDNEECDSTNSFE